MVNIAVLGATGQIGRGLASELAASGEQELLLYARDIDRLQAFIDAQGIRRHVRARDIKHFGQDECDVVINCIGACDPAKVQQIGGEIISLTEEYDNSALAYLTARPATTYIFLSSGAVYGTKFEQPATEDSRVYYEVNRQDAVSLYGLAKMYAETKHRVLANFNIVDLRIFGYFSRYIDLDGRSFMAQLCSALVHGEVFFTEPGDMVRDYVIPADFANLIRCCIERRSLNDAFDVYSAAPVRKFELIEYLAECTNLRYEVRTNLERDDATGIKTHYYTEHQRSRKIGYRPKFTAVEGIRHELDALVRNYRAEA